MPLASLLTPPVTVVDHLSPLSGKWSALSHLAFFAQAAVDLERGLARFGLSFATLPRK